MSEKKYNVDSFNLDHTKVTAPFVRLASEKTGRKGDIVSKYDVRFCRLERFTLWSILLLNI